MQSETQAGQTLGRALELLQDLHKRPCARTAHNNGRRGGGGGVASALTVQGVTRTEAQPSTGRFESPPGPSRAAGPRSPSRPPAVDQKDFYRQRLGLRAGAGADAAQGCSTLSTSHEDTSKAPERVKLRRHKSLPAINEHLAADYMKPGTPRDIEDLQVMCNECYHLVRLVESRSCTGSEKTCALAIRLRNEPGRTILALTTATTLNAQLLELRAGLEARLQDASPNDVNVLRHLTHLRVHIDTAIRWTPGSQELGILSDHTVHQVKQLTIASRALAPAVYIFSKRTENVIVQKERRLRHEAAAAAAGSTCSAGAAAAESAYPSMDVERKEPSRSVLEVNSIVSTLDSDANGGSLCQRTAISSELPVIDVANINDANEVMAHAGEDEQRRWFFSLCMKAKMAIKTAKLARKTLISDLYRRAKSDDIPVERWHVWIREQLASDEPTPIAGMLAAGGYASLPTAPALGADGCASSPPGSGLRASTFLDKKSAGDPTARNPQEDTASSVEEPVAVLTLCGTGGYPQATQLKAVGSPGSVALRGGYPEAKQLKPVGSPGSVVLRDDYPESTQPKPVGSAASVLLRGGYPEATQPKPIVSPGSVLLRGDYPESTQLQPVGSPGSVGMQGDYPEATQPKPVGSPGSVLLRGGYPEATQLQPVGSPGSVLLRGGYPQATHLQPVGSPGSVVLWGDYPEATQLQRVGSTRSFLMRGGYPEAKQLEPEGSPGSVVLQGDYPEATQLQRVGSTGSVVLRRYPLRK